MTLSQGAAATIVPLLSRLLLAVLFVPTGWTMLTSQHTFRGEPLEQLQQLGVIAAPTAERTARLRLDDPPIAPDEALREAAPVVTPPAPQPSEATPATPPGDHAHQHTPPPLPIAPVAEGVEARSLHQWTVTFATADWPRPVLLAWSMALLSLLGGAMLLLGLVTRLWALLLAAAVGSLFWIESAPLVAAHWMFGLEPAQFALVASQSTMTLLAFGLLLSGGGAVSLDRAIFRSTPEVPAYGSTPAAG